MKSNVAVVKHLIDKGANPNIQDKEGLSPLHVAVGGRNDNEIMDLLLAHPKVNVDCVDKCGRTVLHWAAMTSNVVAVKNLIDKGADPDIADKQGLSPLIWAAQERDGIPIIDLLLEAQKVKAIGDVNDRDEEGWTALHWAVLKSNENTAEHLINKGANVNCQDNYGRTPLDIVAPGAEDMKIIDVLLKNIKKEKVDVNCVDNERRTAVSYARDNEHGLGETIIARLRESGAKK
jgi:ankyrin repeat protein